MELTLTKKIQIYPDKKQVEQFETTRKAYADACNYAAKVAYDNKLSSAAKIQKAVYTNIREVYNLPSQMACSVCRTVAAKFKTIHEKQAKWSILPYFSPKVYEVVWNKDYSLKDNMFSVITTTGRTIFKTEWSGSKIYAENEKYGTAQVLESLGKYYIHIPVTFNVEDMHILQFENITGVDLGINFLATTYDSEGKTTFYSGKEAKMIRSEYKKNRSDLQRKGTRSAQKRLKKIGSRESRWMNDMNHVITKALAETITPTLFVLEDLTGIRSATESVRKKDRYVNVSWSFYDFRQKLEYKAKPNGHSIIFVDPKYTSQRCPQLNCGHIEKGNRNKQTHTFKCKKCGYTSNDDRVAAMNLQYLGYLYQVSLALDIFQCYGVLSTTQKLGVAPFLLVEMLSQFKVGETQPFNTKELGFVKLLENDKYLT